MFAALVNRTRIGRAQLAAVVVALLGVVGGLAGSADAARFTDGHWASMSVDCTSDSWTTTRVVEMTTQASTSGIYMARELYVNGRYVGGASFTPISAGVITSWSWDTFPRGTTIRVIVQFAKIVNGRWQYRPREYASHRTLNDGRVVSQGTYCSFV
jgi:hypothetical protein